MDQILDALLMALPYLNLPGTVVAIIAAVIILLKSSGWTKSSTTEKKEQWPPKDFWDQMGNRS